MKKSCLAVSIMLALALTACGASAKAKEHYDLGVKYISAGNYQEAILELSTAIEIDPKQKVIYLELANAYEASGNLHMAKEVLKNGILAIDDDKDKKELWVEYERIEKEIQEAEQEEAENTSAVILKRLFERLENGEDFENVVSEYDEYSHSVGFILFEEVETESGNEHNSMFKETPGFSRMDCRTFINDRGKGVGLYAYDNCNLQLYYGDYVKGKRQGLGYWIDYFPEPQGINNMRVHSVYYGEWNNDELTGNGTFYEYMNVYSGEIRTGEIVNKTIEGHFDNGRLDGAFNVMIETVDTKNNTSITYIYPPVSYDKGYYIGTYYDDEVVIIESGAEHHVNRHTEGVNPVGQYEGCFSCLWPFAYYYLYWN